MPLRGSQGPSQRITGHFPVKCCLCSENGTITEQRPSGRGGRMQTWRYCESCWAECQGTGADLDLICAKYLCFVRWLMAAYRLERRGSRGRVYRIVPKKHIDMSIRTGISFNHGKTKNNIEHRSGFDRPNEISGNPRAPGCIHDHRGTLPDVSGEGREIRSEAEENLTAEAGLEAVEAATKP